MKKIIIKNAVVAVIGGIAIVIGIEVVRTKIIDYGHYKNYQKRELNHKLAIVDTLLEHREAFLDDAFKNITKDELIAFLKNPNNLQHKFFIADGSSEPGVAEFKTALFGTFSDAADGLGIVGEKYTVFNTYLKQRFHKLRIRVPFSLKNRPDLIRALDYLYYKKVKEDSAAEYFEGKPDIY